MVEAEGIEQSQTQQTSLQSGSFRQVRDSGMQLRQVTWDLFSPQYIEFTFFFFNKQKIWLY